MRLAALTLAALATVAPARAASFSIGAFAGNIPIIDVSGQIMDGDDQRFKLFSDALQFAVVRLHSPGGHLLSALSIGEIVRSKHFATYVSAGHECASSCGYLWLAGQPRGKDASAKVGFHAASVTLDGHTEENGAGNAIIGVYMTNLHLNLGAVVWATMAKPNQMAWLTPEIGRATGIEFDTRDEVETSLWGSPPAGAVVANAAPRAPLQLSGAPPKPAPKPLEPPKRAEVKPSSSNAVQPQQPFSFLNFGQDE